MRWQGDQEEFVVSFISAPLEVPRLKEALDSIPDEQWWSIWARLVAALDSDSEQLLPSERSVAQTQPTPGQAGELVFSVIGVKERLIHDEGRRRLAQGSGSP